MNCFLHIFLSVLNIEILSIKFAEPEDGSTPSLKECLIQIQIILCKVRNVNFKFPSMSFRICTKNDTILGNSPEVILGASFLLSILFRHIFLECT